ncbi:MAG: GNAT family N-acetyltransferase [Clostridiaceae bacterium]
MSLSQNKNIKYIIGEEELLDSIQCLWEELNQHHEEKSLYFKEVYSINIFENRKKGLLEKSQGGKLRVHLAKDISMNKIIGYCVSSITDDGIGEVDSIFVQKEYRKLNVGDCLMSSALSWMKENKVKSKIIGVVSGNEEALGFYKKYNFYPSTIILKEK